tara:strand:- start:459 stop:572 length:114 start_codon:yes stop_codon:yes gene_type:complete
MNEQKIEKEIKDNIKKRKRKQTVSKHQHINASTQAIK